MGADSTTEVLELYQKWTRAWQMIDPEFMLSLYDLDSDDLAYQSEENVGPLYTAAELRSYWGAATGILDEIPVWKEKSKKIVVSGDHAFITALLDTKIVAPAFGAPSRERSGCLSVAANAVVSGTSSNTTNLANWSSRRKPVLLTWVRRRVDR